MVNNVIKFESTCCPICGSEKSVLFLNVNNKFKFCRNSHFELQKCLFCDFIYLNPRPVQTDILKFYPSSYAPHKVKNKNQQTKDKFLKELGLLDIKPGKVLDVGCGSGDFLASLKLHGWQTYGVELSAPAAESAKKQGSKIFCGQLQNANFKNDTFDIITLFHVLEHLPNPLLTLLEVKRILRKKGKLILYLPNIDCIQYKLFKTNLFSLDVPLHLNQFTPKTLEKILIKSDYNKYHIETIHNPYVVNQSINNLFEIHQNRIFDILIKPFGLLLCLPGKGEIIKAVVEKN